MKKKNKNDNDGNELLQLQTTWVIFSLEYLSKYKFSSSY